MKRFAITLAALLATLACASLSRAADIHVLHDGVEAFCATSGPTVMGFDAGPYNFTGTCGTPPGNHPLLPAGYTAVGTTSVGYDVQGVHVHANYDTSIAANYLGRAAITDLAPLFPHKHWPGDPAAPTDGLVSGAGPVFVSLAPSKVICSKLPVTLGAGKWQGSITPQSNISGSNPAYRLDIAIGDDCDFIHYRMIKLDAYFNQNPVGYTINLPADPQTLALSHQYYLAIRLSPARGGLPGPTANWPVYVIHRIAKIN